MVKSKQRPSHLIKRLEKRGIYLAARTIVVILFGSILFFPGELEVALETPALLGIMLFANIVMAIILLGDLLMTEQKNISSLMYKYFFLTISIILAYGIFFYINATILEPPGLIALKDAPLNLNSDVFYFSGTTYFTIGYGEIIPIGTYAKFASITEAFVGNIINLIVLATAFQRWVSKKTSRTRN